MIDAATINEWKRRIGNYELDTDTELKKQLGIAADAALDINAYLPTKAARDALYQNTHDVESKDAREDFIAFLGDKFQNLTWDASRQNKTIKLAEFLGEDGLAKYQAAAEEENGSKAFREAVFFRASKRFNGNKWAKKLVLWVGGPSSSGKTYGAKGVIEKLDSEILEKTQEVGGNTVVSVDGSFERETSQMRQMVLQFALAAGYKGIKDLHKHSKALEAKQYVRNAALKEKDLHLVIPDTFVELLIPELVKDSRVIKDEFRDYEKKKYFQVFSEVKAEKGYLERFRTSVKNMGFSRAWRYKKFGEGNIETDIRMNNRDLGCESKIYQPKYFGYGLKGTKLFKKFYKSFSREKLTLSVINDLIYLKKEQGGWIECSDKDNLEGKEQGSDFLRMTARAYNYWKEHETNLPLDEWYDSVGRHTKALTGQVITTKKNEKYFSHSSHFNFIKLTRLTGFFANPANKDKERKLQLQAAVGEERIAVLEAEIANCTEPRTKEFLQKRLSLCKHLQDSLKATIEESKDTREETVRYVRENHPQFLPYVDGYVDIPLEEKNNLKNYSKPAAHKSVHISTDVTQDSQFLAPIIPSGHCRVHYVDDVPSKRGTDTEVMFVQEKIPHTDSGFKLTAIDGSIDENNPFSMLSYSLAIASTLLAGADKAPSPDKPAIVTAKNAQWAKYLWTALVILGERVPEMKFNIEAVHVISPFSVDVQKEIAKPGKSVKYSKTSLHETVFKEYKHFVDMKAKELGEVLRLKADPAAQARLLGKELSEVNRVLTS
ncbi:MULTISPECIES: hypothetical protein [unclassified Legionella]|uniref:hypothetical protein n=1 Tax=unclassified Legionella TaxID=2622702 RepID=UPI00105513E0|nr:MULTISPECIES: hypothetical protein [unclassified Legionella]MDI9819236.1 hypothetical protein [Legionella sp. PL877]